MIAAQKSALNDAARRGLVDVEAADHLIANLDRQLLRSASYGHGDLIEDVDERDASHVAATRRSSAERED